ncbi:MAG: hypothetical protein KC464_34320, partial [Myxococcales bacterium]|nr:hypothetical protein [Myxococcales bacterium]
LARLEGWDGQYDAARARVTRVLAAAPTRLDARLLQVDLALWARQASVARRLIAQLIVDGVGGAELLYRRAQLALLDHQPRRAYELASQVLELDPEHQGARAFRSSIQRFSIEAASEGEVYPDRFAARTALGETITVTLFPRATWSLTAAYEYRRRFGTDNHRVAIRGDWRARPDLALALYARAGAVEVVPRATILLDASWEPEGRWTAGGRYTYDRLPWDGDLHRVQASGGVALPWRLRLEAEVQGGVAASCGQVTGVWGARGRLWWTPRGWETSVSYGYGVEVDRAVVADPCVLPGAGIVDVDVHAVGVTLGHQLGPKLLARLGYGVERRPDDVWVHLASVTLRAWM